MKILHINTSQEGGAAWCARRINNSLLQQGVDSKMLFAYGDCMPECIEGAIAEKDNLSYRNNWFIAKCSHLLMRLPWYWNVEKLQSRLNELNTKHLYLHQPLSNYTNIAHHPLVKWADVIHLHWVPDFVDYPTFFKEVNKPIVWTLHDMYPAIGVMHFESEYTVRPKELNDIDSLCRKIKKEGLSKTKNLHIVAISEKMKNIIMSSDLLRSFPMTLIHNGVDTEVFKPFSHQHSMVSDFITSLEEGTKVFLFSSYGIWDRRKGLDRIVSAMECVKKTKKQKLALIAIGMINEGTKLPEASYPILYTGLIKDQQLLANIYTLVDYFINASYEEAFAQTPLESMACGTPVISTPCSGAYDLIQPFNGVICNGYDAEALSDGISKVLATNYNSNTIRQYIIENFDYKKIAKEYIILYKEILNKWNSQ